MADNVTIGGVTYRAQDNSGIYLPLSGLALANGTPIDASNPLRVLSTADTEYADPTWEIARTGLWHGKAAAVVPILGRRAAFTGTTPLQDIAEYAATAAVAAVPQMTGLEDLEVLSSSASDTAAGTGARTVRVTYIRASDGAQVTTASIPLNGVTPVALGVGLKALAIQWMEVLTVGSGSVAAGTISCRVVGGAATVHEQITAGGNRSMSARYMVPSGTTAYLIDWVASAIAQTMDMRLRATVSSDGVLTTGTVDAYLFKRPMFLAAGQSQALALNLYPIPTGAKIKVSAFPGSVAGSPRADVSFQLLTVAN